MLDAFPVEGLNLKKLFISRPDSGYYSILYPKKSPWRFALDNGNLLIVLNNETLLSRKIYFSSFYRIQGVAF